MPGVVPASDQWKSIDAAAALSKRYSGEPMPKRLVSEMGCVSWLFLQVGVGRSKKFWREGELDFLQHKTFARTTSHDFHKKTNRCRFWLSLAATMNRS